MALTSSPRAQKLFELASEGDFNAFDTLWLETLEVSPPEIDAFLAGISGLESRGNRGKAGMYLGLLVPTLLERGHDQEALVAARKLVDVSPSTVDDEIKAAILTAFQRVYTENPHIDIYVEKSGFKESADIKAATDRLATYLTFVEGAYLVHPAGWGTGAIREVLAEEAAIVIDFEEKAGHRISMEMAAKVTESIGPMDLRALKLDRMEMLQAWVDDEPLEVIRAALRSRRNKATLREIRDRLAGSVIETKSWSRWWQKARAKVKGAGDITLTPGNNPTLELGQETSTYRESCIKSLGQLDDDTKRVRYFRDLLKEAPDQEGGLDAVLAVAAALLGPSGTGTETEPGPRFSLAILMDQACGKFEGLVMPEELRAENLLSDRDSTVHFLPAIPIAAHRISALDILKSRDRDEWPELCEQVILRGENESADHCLDALKKVGDSEEIDRIIQSILDGYRDYPRAFNWMLRLAVTNRLPDAVRLPGRPSLLEKTLIVHSHLHAVSLRNPRDEEAKLTLRNLLTLMQARKFAFIREAFEAASPAEGRSLATLLKNSRSLTGDAHDKLLATMYRVRPELARSAGSRQEEAPSNPFLDPNILFTTESALLRKRQEYEHLVNVEIPENAEAIGVAASYGDLSENAEWSAAIEKQSLLTRKSEEMSADIEKARLIDAGMQDGERVCLGSCVKVRSAEGLVNDYTILGPWDVDADRGVISYLSPLGSSLLGKRAGETAPVDLPSGTANYEVLELTDGLSAVGGAQ